MPAATRLRRGLSVALLLSAPDYGGSFDRAIDPDYESSETSPATFDSISSGEMAWTPPR